MLNEVVGDEDEYRDARLLNCAISDGASKTSSSLSEPFEGEMSLSSILFPDSDCSAVEIESMKTFERFGTGSDLLVTLIDFSALKDDDFEDLKVVSDSSEFSWLSLVSTESIDSPLKIFAA